MSNDGSDRHNLTNQQVRNVSDKPVWSPDGDKIAFSSTNTTGGRSDIFVMNVNVANGSAWGRRNLTFPNGYQYNLSPAWSPDSMRIAFVGWSPNHTLSDICTVDLRGTVKNITEQLPNGKNVEPAWGPWR